MAKRKIKSGIGIELTGERINLVRLERTPEGIVLTEARSIKLPASEKKEEEQLLVNNVTKAFEGLDFAEDEISLGVGGHMSFVRKVKLPPVSQSKLKQVVSFEVQQQVPFSLNEVIWNYQIISPISKIPGPVVVLIAAIKQSFVENLLKVLKDSINKIPELVDISSLALHNCLIFNDMLPKEKVGILVNLGFGYTDVSIESKGSMAFTRAVPIGKRNLLKKIADARSVKMEQAEEILEKEDVSSIILPVWEDLVAEIKRTTNYYLSQVEKVTHFQYVYLAGEIPKNAALPSILKNSFRADVEEINPLKKISYNPAQLTVDAGNFCVSVGLALRALEHFPVEVNLLPSRILNERELSSKRPYFISSLIVLFFICCVLLVSGKRNYNLTKEEINMIEPILRDYRPYVAKAEQLKSERQKITSKLQNIEEILKQKSQLSDILLEISEFTPSNIYITEISTVGAEETTSGRAGSTGDRGRDLETTRIVRTIPRMTTVGSMQGDEVSPRLGEGVTVNREASARRISLTGISDSYPAVDEYIKQLKTSPLFKTVELISATSTLQEEGGTLLTQPGTELRGRTPRRPQELSEAERMLLQRGREETVQKEKVQFTLEIGLEK
jgi:type IV pilus assembly protein PilM